MVELTDSISASVAVQRRSNLLKKAAFCAAFFVSQGLLACPEPESLSPPMRLERVTDGDTLRLENGQRVRIVGINTLELRSQGWFQDHARQAKDQAAAFLPEWVQLTPWPAPTDRYGRLLANIWHQETYLAAELVTKGLAFAVAVPPNQPARAD